MDHILKMSNLVMNRTVYVCEQDMGNFMGFILSQGDSKEGYRSPERKLGRATLCERCSQLAGPSKEKTSGEVTSPPLPSLPISWRGPLVAKQNLSRHPRAVMYLLQVSSPRHRAELQ